MRKVQGIVGPFAVAALCLTGQAWAVPTPSQMLTDVGVNPYRDLDSQTVASGVAYVTDDRVSRGNRVGAGTGGQRFDAEGLYAWRTATTAYVVLSSGFRTAPGNIRRRDYRSSPDSKIAGVKFKDGGKKFNYAGDLMIDVGQDGSYDYGISMGAYQNARGRAGLAYGDLYSVDQTGGYDETGVYRAGHTDSGAFIGVAESELGSVDFSNEAFMVRRQAGEDMQGATGNRARHLVVFAIDLAQYADLNQALTLHWTMECGNDVLNLNLAGLPVGGLPPSGFLPDGDLFNPPLLPGRTQPVPEPATMLLLVFGGAAVAVWRGRRRPAAY